MQVSGTKLAIDNKSRSRNFLVLGAGGAGMAAAIDILRDCGQTVFGFDDGFRHVSATPQNQAGAEQRFHIVRTLDDLTRFDACIASPAFTADHPVRRRVLEAGLPTISLPQFIGETFAGKKQICVAGTHGKSTTAALITWILEQNGEAASYFVGARISAGGSYSERAMSTCANTTSAAASDVLPNALLADPMIAGATGVAGATTVGGGRTVRSGRFTSSEWAVIESCEYAHSFLNFRPQIAVLTGIERDHFDFFPDQAAEDWAYLQFLRNGVSGCRMIGWSDCLRSHRLCSQLSDRRRTELRLAANAASKSGPANWTLTDVRPTADGISGQLWHDGQFHSVRLPLPGRQNLRNAVSAIAAAAATGLPVPQCCRAVQSFPGLQRRFELRGRYRGIDLVDDYAHHPTAIRHALQATRERFPGRRVIVVMEPHQVSRLRSLFDRFVEALIPADEILVLPVFAAREHATLLECCRVSGDLVRSINQRGGRSFLFANLDQIAARIDHSAKPHDVLLTLGAGRTNLIHDEFHRRLQRHSVA